VHTQTQPLLSVSNLKHLPSYAGYLLKNRLRSYVEFTLHLSQKLNLPLLKALGSMNDEQIVSLGMETSKEYLTYLAQNKAEEQIETSLIKWIKNQLPVIDQKDVGAEDITLLSYVRKQAFLHFITEYTNDIQEIVALIEEIDLFITRSETESTNTFIDLLRNRIREQSYLNEKITNTAPGIIYLFDLSSSSITFINKTAEEFFGITLRDFIRLGSKALETFIDPNDLERATNVLKEIANAREDDVWSIEYRLKNHEGEYVWVSNTMSIFKRNDEGMPAEMIGNIITIQKEKVITEQLKQREEELRQSEELYKQAQLLSHIGHYSLDLKTKEVFLTEELKRICDFDLNKDVFHYSEFISMRHPEDAERVDRTMKHTFTTYEPFDFDYRIVTPDGNKKTIHAIGEVMFDKEGNASKLVGTFQDVSERYEILEKLRKSDLQHKQAEALTHIGSYLWHLEAGELEWSDEMFRIYGMEPSPGGKIKSDSIRPYNYPDDNETVNAAITESIREKKPHDFYYRIILNDGTTKILHARGNVVVEKDKVTKLIGTAQDVTEKQTLIRRLRQSESMYQKAEALANMGNYLLDLTTNEVQWTDQLYKIYGLEPQSEKITIDRFFSFIHPDDLAFVKKSAEEFFEKKSIDYTFRIVTAKNEVKTIRSIGQIQENEKGEFTKVIGIEQDITERQAFIQQLQRSEYIYRQAEVLANMGNWSWDMTNQKLEWTDQLYRIYGLEPQSEEITIERFINFVHPENRALIQENLDKGFPEDFIDMTFRIVTDYGVEKTLRSIAQVQKNEQGQIINIIGTEQDITERQNLISMLQESEKLYKQAQALSKLGNWSLDLKTKYYTWSDEMYHIYELEKNTDFSFDKWLSYIHPDDKEEAINYLEECIRERKPYEKIHRIIIPGSGIVKTLHRRGEFMFNEHGEPIKLIGTTQDVTEQSRIQQELKENQTFIRKIADATPSIITAYNINTGHYTFISEGLQKLLGYDSEEAKAKGVPFFVDIIHPDDLEPLMAKNAEALKEANRPENRDQSEIVEFIYRMRHTNGTYLWFHTYGTVFDRNANGDVEHVLNISLDVTDQYEAIRTIEEQEHFIEHIADASPTVLYLFDIASDSIVYVNREIFFVLGYSRDDILEMGNEVTSKLYHPDDIHLLPERKLSDKKIAEQDIMLQYECRMKNKEGEWQWFLVREVVFKTDDKGNVLQIVGAALDITLRKEMEKTLLQNSFQLEQSNASLEEFAYIASHDLKEPLRKISTFGDRLVANSSDKLTPEGKIYLNKIIDASQRMQTMINDLLSISMISGDKSFEHHSLQQILNETLQTLEFKIEQKNAIIKADPLPEANIIPSQFRQLFQNLLSNSLKFVHEDKQPVIIIRCSYLKPSDVTEYGLTGANQYLKLEFRDNGIGFENEFAGRIFAIFQRLHGRSEYEGSGIGLAICKKIVEHHGGVIYASGLPDEGATFSIILLA
jgi:PAS domain S-box-containing protein